LNIFDRLNEIVELRTQGKLSERDLSEAVSRVVKGEEQFVMVGDDNPVDM